MAMNIGESKSRRSLLLMLTIDDFQIIYTTIALLIERSIMQFNHRLFFSLVCISTLSIGSIDLNRSSLALSLATTKSVKCSKITASSQLESYSGFPSNRSKYIYNDLPFRASAGAYYVAMKNGRYCMMDDNGEKKDLRAAVKKFTETYGSQPLGVCEAPNSGKFTCKSISTALKERR
jgi:hypothetical protein